MIAKTIQQDLQGRSFEEVAISRIREYEPPEGYYLAFSGGKDSVVIYDLAVRAGVKFDAHFSRTTVDPPEVLDFIKENYPDVIWEKPKMSMFQLIRKKGVPTRFRRWCCSELKEIGGKNRVIITGIRWQESFRRKKRQVWEKGIRTRSKWFLHPIIDWTDLDVWGYIRSRKIPYCPLYDKGANRVGCIMCPMQSSRGMKEDAKRYPKFYKAYLRAIQGALDNGKKIEGCETAEDVMYWWMNNGETRSNEV